MDEKLRNYLLQEGIETLTPIQEKSIPVIMSGQDMLGVSPTGTGKTYAYLLPVVERLDMSVNRPQAIVLAPTHELCSQVCKIADAILKSMYDSAEAALIIGGANINRQLEKLKRKPKIIVGSYGRILEIIKLKKISGHYIRTIVIDEADRMLDEQNAAGVQAIIRTTLKDRQLLFFTASAGKGVLGSAKELAGDGFVVVDTANEFSMPEKITHMYVECELRDKFELLRKIIHADKITKGIVFINKSDDVDFLTNRLAYHGISVVALHGQTYGEERRQALNDFRDGRFNVLVASDLAARGLDIPDVTHIICMDVPDDPTFYLHRAGRAGRMGREGVSITLASKGETHNLKKIEKRYGVSIVAKKVRYGKLLDME